MFVRCSTDTLSECAEGHSGCRARRSGWERQAPAAKSSRLWHILAGHLCYPPPPPMRVARELLATVRRSVHRPLQLCSTYMLFLGLAHRFAERMPPPIDQGTRTKRPWHAHGISMSPSKPARRSSLAIPGRIEVHWGGAPACKRSRRRDRRPDTVLRALHCTSFRGEDTASRGPGSACEETFACVRDAHVPIKSRAMFVARSLRVPLAENGIGEVSGIGRLGPACKCLRGRVRRPDEVLRALWPFPLRVRTISSLSSLQTKRSVGSPFTVRLRSHIVPGASPSRGAYAVTTRKARGRSFPGLLMIACEWILFDRRVLHHSPNLEHGKYRLGGCSRVSTRVAEEGRQRAR